MQVKKRVFGIWYWCFILVAGSISSNSFSAEPPNIVIIISDDLGWTDAGCYGSDLYETPNIDRLAEEGLRFTNAYTAASLCSPMRASFQTGQTPARLHLTDVLNASLSPVDSPLKPAESLDNLPTETLSIAEVMHQVGYTTGLLGKWHIGGRGSQPQDHGWDVFDPDFRHHGGDYREDNNYCTDLMADNAEQFIRDNADSRFFLMLSFYAMHIPLASKQSKYKKYHDKLATRPVRTYNHGNAWYAGMLESIDDGVGQVRDVLKELGLDDNTVVIYYSDNGGLSNGYNGLLARYDALDWEIHSPPTNNAPLRSGKGHLYEGGIRVPLVVRWPGVTRAGALRHTPVSSIDFLPTFAEMAGLEVASLKTHGPLDGASMLPVLKGDDTDAEQRTLYWHYPHFSNEGGRPGAAIRDGDWKLIWHYETDAVELYNLQEDLSEMHDLVNAMPQKAKQMKEKLNNWLSDSGALMPIRK